MNQRGFSLLEVVVATTILAISLSVLIKVQAENIAKINQNFEKIKALKVFKLYLYGQKVPQNQFYIKEKRIKLPYGITQIKNSIISRKTATEILEITTYEK